MEYPIFHLKPMLLELGLKGKENIEYLELEIPLLSLIFIEATSAGVFHIIFMNR